MDVDFAEWRVERNATLVALDMAYARRLMPTASSDEARRVAMHKARYECRDLEAELRHTSSHWLRERNYGGMTGPLLPEGELPA